MHWKLTSTMLAGIKKGKRKRKNESGSSSGKGASKKPAMITNSSSSSATTNNSSSQNHDAAAELRKMLAGGGKPSSLSNANVSGGTNSSTSGAFSGATTRTTNSLHASKKEQLMSVLERFEKRRGGGSTTTASSTAAPTSNEETIVINTTTDKAPVLSKEDFRRGARKGKVKQKESYMRSSADQTIAEMVEEEKKAKQKGAHDQDMDETFARNIQRLGSRYKGSDFKLVAGSTAGADEDDGTSIDMKMFTNAADRLTDAEKYKREISRQMALSKKQNSIADKCWWWIESEKFQKHRLIALGDHVSTTICGMCHLMFM